MENITFSAAQFTATTENLLQSGGTIPLTVTGNSMNPFLIDKKDTVWLKAHSEADIKTGKILLFKKTDGSIVLHRVRRILPDGYILMNGDAQLQCEKIKPEQVIAVATHLQRNSKKRLLKKRPFWHILYPLRPLILKFWRKLRVIYGKNK